jgi:hypothetical protein
MQKVGGEDQRAQREAVLNRDGTLKGNKNTYFLGKGGKYGVRTNSPLLKDTYLYPAPCTGLILLFNWLIRLS